MQSKKSRKMRLYLQNDGLYPEKLRFSWEVLDEQFGIHFQWFA